jgi:hypothetical protein
MRYIFSIFFFLFLFADLYAQDIAKGITPVNNDDVPLLYRNEQEFGGVAHSSGWGFNYRRCKHVTGYKKRILEFELVGMKSPKEIKTSPPSDIGIKPYFYGKQFTVTFLRVGWGMNKVITGKSERKGVEIRLVTIAGPVMAFAKPVYLNVWYPDTTNSNSGTIITQKYDPTNPEQTQNNIAGRASYFTGFGQMQFFPGAFCKLALSFEHGKNDTDIQLLETGIVVDGFYKTIPIMANARNNQVYINVYLNIMFGKKWF